MKQEIQVQVDLYVLFLTEPNELLPIFLKAVCSFRIFCLLGKS